MALVCGYRVWLLLAKIWHALSRGFSSLCSADKDPQSQTKPPRQCEGRRKEQTCPLSSSQELAACAENERHSHIHSFGPEPVATYLAAYTRNGAWLVLRELHNS